MKFLANKQTIRKPFKCLNNQTKKRKITQNRAGDSLKCVTFDTKTGQKG